MSCTIANGQLHQKHARQFLQLQSWLNKIKISNQNTADTTARLLNAD